uniref:Uncharacterized protein n=1 Tax=Rhizophora mucronata TaxID=61149 RepID=A0A2P2IXR5_RHIMU
MLARKREKLTVYSPYMVPTKCSRIQ